jgi:hypothetical protein
LPNVLHKLQALNFDGDEFALVDTLFSLAEAYLYCQLVELKDSPQGPGLASKSYMQLYKARIGSSVLVLRG